MEKKTIGSFIAVLRKAAGMTQRELAEKLNVSDKSVSRWERDECAPDLSLIPVIAEIFGVTADELLRGERKPSKENENAEESVWQREKSTRQFQNLLRIQTLRFKERSLITFGITCGGFLTALICNFAFYRATLGFFLASAFDIAAIILEICFLRRAVIEEDDAFDYGKWLAYQNKITYTGVRIFFSIWLFFSMTLPLLVFGGELYGIELIGYIILMLFFVLIALIVGYIAYVMEIKPILIKKNVLFLTDTQKENARKKRKLLAKTLGISGTIALVLLIGSFVIFKSTSLFAEKTAFHDAESFKTYMEPDTSDDFHDGHLYTIRDRDGDLLCTFFWNNADVVTFEPSADGFPVYVITREAWQPARTLTEQISFCFALAAGLQAVIAAIIYLWKARRYR